jgi:hypothetical protein
MAVILDLRHGTEYLNYPPFGQLLASRNAIEKTVPIVSAASKRIGQLWKPYLSQLPLLRNASDIFGPYWFQVAQEESADPEDDDDDDDRLNYFCNFDIADEESRELIDRVLHSAQEVQPSTKTSFHRRIFKPDKTSQRERNYFYALLGMSLPLSILHTLIEFTVGTLQGEVWSKLLLEHRSTLSNLFIDEIIYLRDKFRNPSLVFHYTSQNSDVTWDELEEEFGNPTDDGNYW